MSRMAADRDRDTVGRPRNARPRDAMGRPLPRGAEGSISEEQLPSDPDALLDLGIGYFNAHRFFQAHECWEEAWHGAPEADRDFWQGITQVAVGFTHRQRGNPAGATTLLERGADKIERYAPRFYGIDVVALARAARAAAGVIARDGITQPVDIPAIARYDG